MEQNLKYRIVHITIGEFMIADQQNVYKFSAQKEM
jgi:hypothetical protein